MAILLADLPIPVVNNQFRTLVLADLTSKINCGLLGLKVFDRPFASANLNIPATIGVGNYVVRF